MAQPVKRKRAGLLSPTRLWLLSISLREHGHPRLALAVKRINALLYHNSLSVSASVSPDIKFEHHSFGVMVHDNVVIGPKVRMWHHVTLTVRGHVGAPAKLIIEEDVKIGAHAIVVTPIGKDLRIGRAARIGAGAIVSHDVPPGATVVSPPARVLTHRADTRLARLDAREPLLARYALGEMGMSNGSDAPVEVSPERVASWLDEAGSAPQLIDVREDYEREAGHIAGSRHIELNNLPSQAASLTRERPVVLYCRVGARSDMAAAALRSAGFEAYSMAGGLLRWADEGRPLVPDGGRVSEH